MLDLKQHDIGHLTPGTYNRIFRTKHSAAEDHIAELSLRYIKRTPFKMNPEVLRQLAQVHNRQVPEGLEKTRLGLHPKDWTICKIGDCLERVGEPVQVEEGRLYTQIGIRSHGKGLFYKDPVTGQSLGNKAVFWIQPDCFILNIVFAWEQAIGRTTTKEKGMIGSHRFPMYRPKNQKADIDYLIYYFLTKRGGDILETASPGGAGRNKTLGQSRFLESKIVLPPIHEQRRIAVILSAQDHLIELKEKRLEEKKRQKKYLMQQLLTGKKRLPGFGGKWGTRSLKELSHRIANRNTIGNTNVLTISAQHGLICQTDFFDKNIASEDKSQYYLLQKNDFAYNKSSSTEHPLGAIKRLLFYPDGIVSPLYICFRFDTGLVSLDFMEQYFESNKLDRQIRAIAQEGARNHGLLNISINDFFALAIQLPRMGEQKAIADVLSTADREIELLEQDLDAEREKKKALMQLLLTGIVRVDGPSCSDGPSRARSRSAAMADDKR